MPFSHVSRRTWTTTATQNCSSRLRARGFHGQRVCHSCAGSLCGHSPPTAIPTTTSTSTRQYPVLTPPYLPLPPLLPRSVYLPATCLPLPLDYYARIPTTGYDDGNNSGLMDVSATWETYHYAACLPPSFLPHALPCHSHTSSSIYACTIYAFLTLHMPFPYTMAIPSYFISWISI